MESHVRLPFQWHSGATQQQKHYVKLATDERFASPTPVGNDQNKDQMEPLLLQKISTTIDVGYRHLGLIKDVSKFNLPDTPSKRKARLGQDHSVLQAAKTQDYWLLFFAMGCGTGSGLTAINNLAQMAESAGSKSIGAFVALVSVWNFLGRMGAGYMSEHYMKKHAIPRPLFLLLVQAVMGFGHLMFASSVPALLYVASILVGLAHGAHWTLMVATSSELFGLQHFGALYNTLSISATVGSYLLSVRLAGYLYDRQVVASEAQALATGQELGSSHKCVGPQCFRSTFLIMTCVCMVGCLALIRLVIRTKKVYVDLHKLQQAKDAMKENPKGVDTLLTTSFSEDLLQAENTTSEHIGYKVGNLSDAHRFRHTAPNRTDLLEC